MFKYILTNNQIDLCINEVSQNNQDALKKLYDEFGKPIFLFALSIVKDYQLAEDVAQETFLEIMASAKNYRMGTNPKAWIFSIARNISADTLKSHYKNVLLSDEEMNDIPDLSNMSLLENRTDAFDALNTLDLLEKQIISLYLFSGLKQIEIAKVLDISYIKVRSKYGYAIKKLKNYYAKRR